MPAPGAPTEAVRARATAAVFGVLLGGIALAMGAACGGGGERRVVTITQTDDACSPAIIDVQAGEALTFRVSNEGRKDHELEGIDGTKLEEVLVPAGRTRNVGYKVPSSGAVQKVKCYIPGGAATVIQLNVAGASGEAAPAADDPATAGTGKKVRTTVGVVLQDYVVKAEPSEAPSGSTRFRAVNNSPVEVHELAVLKAKPDGSYENVGEIEDVGPGETAEIVVDLSKGTYLLACLIVPGEAGSTVDHLAEGMKAPFVVK